MFRFFTERRRRKLTQAPFPASWEEVLHRNFTPYGLLDDAGKAHLRALIQVFAAEKNWEGAGGLKITDEIRVTISAYACLLLLGLSHDYYRNVLSIIVYPSTVMTPERRAGFFETTLDPVKQPMPILGEAHLQGPVIIIWDSVLRSARHSSSGHNVVYHEFAHKLDMLDGLADGTPPMRDRAEYDDWVQTCSREYLRLKESSEKGEHSFLDAYGATNEAEFFAVATEQFFDYPQVMLDHAPDLYRVLREYYHQDPGRVGKGREL